MTLRDQYFTLQLKKLYVTYLTVNAKLFGNMLGRLHSASIVAYQDFRPVQSQNQF
jgi:hypothetical protein